MFGLWRHGFGSGTQAQATQATKVVTVTAKLL